MERSFKMKTIIIIFRKVLEIIKALCAVKEATDEKENLWYCNPKKRGEKMTKRVKRIVLFLKRIWDELSKAQAEAHDRETRLLLGLYGEYPLSVIEKLSSKKER